MARRYSRNSGKNVSITGFPGGDAFVYGGRVGPDVWKNPDTTLKRIIWAPHHTVERGTELSYSCFLRYHQVMLEIACRFHDKLQIAFKPHPLLKEKLNLHDEWGHKRTDDYYQRWNSINNGQVNTDDYVNLFNTSDAMIFDSVSFITEYLYCGKPALFICSDPNVLERFNEFGKLALAQHYHAVNELEILDFIEKVVCNGEDAKKDIRASFYKDYLVPPNNKSASENVYDEIVKEIWP